MFTIHLSHFPASIQLIPPGISSICPYFAQTPLFFSTPRAKLKPNDSKLIQCVKKRNMNDSKIPTVKKNAKRNIAFFLLTFFSSYFLSKKEGGSLRSSLTRIIKISSKCPFCLLRNFLPIRLFFAFFHPFDGTLRLCLSRICRYLAACFFFVRAKQHFFFPPHRSPFPFRLS